MWPLKQDRVFGGRLDSLMDLLANLRNDADISHVKNQINSKIEETKSFKQTFPGPDRFYLTH